MSKIISVLLAAVMLLGLTSCLGVKTPDVEEIVEEIKEQETVQEENNDTPEAVEPIEDAEETETEAPPIVTEVDVKALPESLTDFLMQFNGWYYNTARSSGKVFDSENAADGTSNIMACIVANGSCVNFNLYPGKNPEDHWSDGTMDPRGWAEEYKSYAVFDGETVDWIAENIFNISEQDISELIKQGEADESFYMEGNQNGEHSYYTVIGGVGDPFLMAVPTSATYDGEKYYVTYDLFFSYDGTPEDYIATYYTVVELKNIDGNEYWSMFSHGAGIAG